jgi:hypothetical protein
MGAGSQRERSQSVFHVLVQPTQPGNLTIFVNFLLNVRPIISPSFLVAIPKWVIFGVYAEDLWVGQVQGGEELLPKKHPKREYITLPAPIAGRV